VLGYDGVRAHTTLQAVIFGPDDTPWEGGTFKLLLEFTEDYPNKPPGVRFLTRMFHPNIYNNGAVSAAVVCTGERRWTTGHVAVASPAFGAPRAGSERTRGLHRSGPRGAHGSAFAAEVCGLSD
jgi:Ubiquitin-conjugating enzyme